jgi:hypothetical protein
MALHRDRQEDFLFYCDCDTVRRKPRETHDVNHPRRPRFPLTCPFSLIAPGWRISPVGSFGEYSSAKRVGFTWRTGTGTPVTRPNCHPFAFGCALHAKRVVALVRRRAKNWPGRRQRGIRGLTAVKNCSKEDFGHLYETSRANSKFGSALAACPFSPRWTAPLGARHISTDVRAFERDRRAHSIAVMAFSAAIGLGWLGAPHRSIAMIIPVFVPGLRFGLAHMEGLGIFLEWGNYSGFCGL